MKPILKWTGGKSSELPILAGYVPAFQRTIEPFMGGGAFYFNHEKPGLVNDYNFELIAFYELIRSDLSNLVEFVGQFQEIRTRLGEFPGGDVVSWCEGVSDNAVYQRYLTREVNSKKKGIIKHGIVDTEEYLLTAGYAACYYWCRELYNKFRNSDEIIEWIGSWYVMREIAYSGMFRFSVNGFNVPYGGASYNKKNLLDKLVYCDKVAGSAFYQDTVFSNLDFAEFLSGIEYGDGDFIFLDPPYDSEFSQYNEDADFTRDDQVRLRDCLRGINVPWMNVIKQTDFISELYKEFRIVDFDKAYSVNFHNRNDRSVNHLIIMNY